MADDLLARLAELLPPPAEPPPPVDWDAHARELGIALPPDFRAFHDRYGEGGVFDSAFTVHVPGLSQIGWSPESHLRELMREGLRDRRAVFPEPGGLLTFATTESTKWYVMWDTATWEVVCDDTIAGEVATGLTFLPWLVGALAGELEPRLFPEELLPPDDDDAYPPPEGEPTGVRGHWWLAPGRALVPSDVRDVLLAWGSDPDSAPPTWSVDLDLRRLGTPAPRVPERFDALLAVLPQRVRDHLVATLVKPSDETGPPYESLTFSSRRAAAEAASVVLSDAAAELGHAPLPEAALAAEVDALNVEPLTG